MNEFGGIWRDGTFWDSFLQGLTKVKTTGNDFRMSLKLDVFPRLLPVRVSNKN